MKFSFTKLDTWATCKRKYYYKYIEKIVPKHKKKSLVIGSIIHESLEKYYTNREETIGSIKKYSDKLVKEGFNEYDILDDINNITNIMKMYILHYRNQEIEPIEVEKELEVEIYPHCKFTFKIDLLCLLKDRLTLIDHKTYSSNIGMNLKLTDMQ